MTDCIQVVTTVGKRSDAETLAAKLVSERLAACVQVLGPIASTYWWEGQIETAEEWLLLAKSRQELYQALEQAIRAIHPYQTPEILAFAATDGYDGYLEWLRAETRDEARNPKS